MTLSLSAEVILFDMDRTLLDAALVVERIWAAWARRHDANVAAFQNAALLVGQRDLARCFPPCYGAAADQCSVQ